MTMIDPSSANPLKAFGDRFPGYILDLSGPWPEASSSTGETWLCGFKVKRLGYREIAVPMPGETPAEALELGIEFLEEYLAHETRGERVWEEMVVRRIRDELLSRRSGSPVGQPRP